MPLGASSGRPECRHFVDYTLWSGDFRVYVLYTNRSTVKDANKNEIGELLKNANKNKANTNRAKCSNDTCLRIYAYIIALAPFSI